MAPMTFHTKRVLFLLGPFQGQPLHVSNECGKLWGVIILRFLGGRWTYIPAQQIAVIVVLNWGYIPKPRHLSLPMTRNAVWVHNCSSGLEMLLAKDLISGKNLQSSTEIDKCLSHHTINSAECLEAIFRCIYVFPGLCL